MLNKPRLYCAGDQHALYGNQRMWGAVGFGIFSLLAGVLVDEMSRGLGGSYKEYSGVFYMMLFLIAFDVLSSSKMEVSTFYLILNK